MKRFRIETAQGTFGFDTDGEGVAETYRALGWIVTERAPLAPTVVLRTGP